MKNRGSGGDGDRHLEISDLGKDHSSDGSGDRHSESRGPGEDSSFGWAWG